MAVCVVVARALTLARLPVPVTRYLIIYHISYEWRSGGRRVNFLALSFIKSFVLVWGEGEGEDAGVAWVGGCIYQRKV